jgi:hypothetical protein
MTDTPETDEWGEDEFDLSSCPYYARCNSLPGHDPNGTCFQMGACSAAGEPQCVTCEPIDGWPSLRARGVQS